MRIHGSGGYPGGGPKANWKQDKQNTPNPAASTHGSGHGWGNWNDKGQGDQFQSSFDLSQQGNGGNHGSWGRHGGDHGFGGWHHDQAGNPFKTDSTQTPTPASGSSGSGSDGATTPASPTASSGSSGSPTPAPAPSPSDSPAGNVGDTPNYSPSPVSSETPSAGYPYSSSPSPSPSATPSGSPSESSGGDPSGSSSSSTPSASPSPSEDPSGSPSGSTSTGNPFGGGKEGLGVNGTSSNGDGSNLASTKASWYYNWSPNASSNVNDPNATFIPMVWGQGNMNSQDLQAAANSNSPMLLTFNEPELASQANMTPQQALDDWSQLEATGKKLSSPAISNDPNGINWLDQFMSGASAGGHRVDSIALHWYGSTGQSTEQNLSSMKDFIDQVHNKYPNMPIDLTEFGVDPNGLTAGTDQDFLTQAEQMLNGMPYVQMYSPYGLGTINGN